MIQNGQNLLPFDESYVVIPGKFLAGEYPGRMEEFQTRKRVQSLIKCGTRVCVDLTKPGEISSGYRDVFLEELDLNGFKGNYFHFPIYDFGIPSEEQMSRTLDIIDQSIARSLPVYLHCHAGIGRTGLTVGCYLVRHGMNGNEALSEIKQLRLSVPSHWARSPETDAQVDFIRNWQKGK
jgi:predicted protein tyrosine phosphatase